MFDYPLDVYVDENPGIAFTCPDIPEFNAIGDDLSALSSEAVEGVESALSIYVDQRKKIPEASKPESGQVVLHLPSVTVAKIILWNTLLETGICKSHLARMLGVDPVQVERLIDFLHESEMQAIENALSVLELRIGKTVEMPS